MLPRQPQHATRNTQSGTDGTEASSGAATLTQHPTAGSDVFGAVNKKGSDQYSICTYLYMTLTM